MDPDGGVSVRPAVGALRGFSLRCQDRRGYWGRFHRAFDPPVAVQSSRDEATCLWLRVLPRLTPTSIVEGREARVHREPPGPERWRNRSRTYPGFAAAMAEQWGGA